MQRLWYFFVWLSRITHCRGFGIQSPADYWLVRYVINEHWPYYQYDTLGLEDDWLTRKLGRLYFRLANWCQPMMIESDDYQEYLQAGCRKAIFGESTELIRVSLGKMSQNQIVHIYNKVREDSVLIVEKISEYPELWRQMVADKQSVITFDLYYCGIILFNKKRHKQNYIVNF